MEVVVQAHLAIFMLVKNHLDLNSNSQPKSWNYNWI